MTEHGANNTPPARPESTPLPAAGMVFNFSKILDAVLIPRVIAQNPDLQPGARLLWGVIRQRAWRDGVCTSSDADLAREVAVSPRQLRRYLGSLINHGFLRSTPRAGDTPRRALLWNECFNQSVIQRSQTEEAKRRLVAERRRPPSGNAGGAA